MPRGPENCACWLLLALQLIGAALSVAFWVEAGLALHACHRRCAPGLWWPVALAAGIFPFAVALVLVSAAVLPQALGPTRADIETWCLPEKPWIMAIKWNGVAAVCCAMLAGALSREGCSPAGDACMTFGRVMMWVLGGALGMHAVQIGALKAYN